MTEPSRALLTADQAAAYLQVDRATIYRSIRQGKLVAAKQGRHYRIPKWSLDWLPWATRTRADMSLRAYTDAEIAAFLAADQLDKEVQAIVRRSASASGTG